jgi:tetratricopeptide (TPR) repeat protein
VRYLHQAKQLGPLNFLAHYTYAREKFLMADSGTQVHPLEKEPAAEIKNELQKSLALMPDFGPAQHLLGFFEMIQGEDLAAAQKHIERAIQLEPENLSYVLALAQVQLAKQDPAAARRTLEPLCLPYVERHVRAHAEEMIKALAQ